MARHDVDLAAGFMAQDLEHVVKDFMVLSWHADIDLALAGNQQAKSKLSNEFLIFTKAKKIYDQIRLLNLQGQEIIRVDYNHGQSYLQPEQHLQSKADRYYFQRALPLEQGKYYISRFDLNIENGKIELPHKPTLRISSAIFNGAGEQIGVLVLNYRGKQLLDTVRSQISVTVGIPLLIDHQGYYLIGPSPEDEWGFLFGQDANFPATSPGAFKQLIKNKKGQFESAGYLFTFNTVPFGNERWTVLARSPRLSTLNYLINEQGYSLVAALTLILMAALTAWWFAGSRLSLILWELSETKLVDYKETTSDWLWEIDKHMNFTEISHRLKNITGIDPNQYIGKPLTELLIPVTEELSTRDPLETIRQQKQLSKSHFMIENYLGQRLYFQVSAKPYFIDNEFNGYRGTCQDITNYKHLARELQNRVVAAEIAEDKAADYAARLAEAQHISHIGSWTLDHTTGEFYWSNEIVSILGLNPDGLIPGVDAIINTIHPGDRESVLEQYKESLTNHQTLEIEHRIIHEKDRMICWVKHICVHQYDPDNGVSHTDGIIQDITENKILHEELKHSALTDEVTGLANRKSFYQQLELHHKLAKREEKQLGLLMIGLDGFKSVNDTYGHQVSDGLLKHIATILTQNCREVDVIARLGDDEFILVLVHPENKAAISEMAERIINEITKPVAIANNEIQIGISIGISVFSADGDNLQELILKADSALCQAKGSENNIYVFSEQPPAEENR